MKCPSSDVDTSLTSMYCEAMNDAVTSDTQQHHLSSENDPKMINRSTVRRRLHGRRNDTDTHLICENKTTMPQLLQLPSKINRLKPTPSSFLATTGSTGPGSSTPTKLQPCRSLGTSTNIGPLGNFRTWNSLLRSNSTIRRTDSGTIGVVLPVEAGIDDMEIPLGLRHEIDKCPKPRSISMTSASSTTSYWKQASVPSTCTSSLTTTSIDTSMTTESRSYRRDASTGRRRVRFNETLNMTIESELSPINIKEYRKYMWWSSKDRTRSLKQRDKDLQTIMKQNHKTELPLKKASVLVLEQSDDADSQAIETMDIDSENDESNAAATMILSDYCQAVVTVYMYCHRYSMKAKDLRTTPTHNDKNPQIPLRLNRKVIQAIHVIVTSKYRGLERIVCKILQIQKESQLASLLLLHDDDNDDGCSRDALRNSISLSNQSSKKCSRPSTFLPMPTSLPSCIENTTVANATATTTAIAINDAEDSTTCGMSNSTSTIIEVVSLLSSSSSTSSFSGTTTTTTSTTNHELLLLSLEDQSDEQTAATILTIPASATVDTTSCTTNTILQLPQHLSITDLPIASFTSSTTIPTALLIRKRVIDYQTLLRSQHVRLEHDHYTCRNNDDENCAVVHSVPPVETSALVIVLTDDEQQQRYHRQEEEEEEEQPLRRRKSPTAMMVTNEISDSNDVCDGDDDEEEVVVLLSKLYQSFLLHDISIIWAHLIAMGDASIIIK